MKIEQFAEMAPEFKPESFLAGSLEGWGILRDPLGGLRGRFTVKASGVWAATEGALHFTETWSLDNGHVDTLQWTIKPAGDGSYAGSEPRLEGEAKGDKAGPAFHWRYTRDTPQPGGGSTKLHFDDWFWRVGDDGIVVHGTAMKLGVPFASAFVTYRKTA